MFTRVFFFSACICTRQISENFRKSKCSWCIRVEALAGKYLRTFDHGVISAENGLHHQTQVRQYTIVNYTCLKIQPMELKKKFLARAYIYK